MLLGIDVGVNVASKEERKKFHTKRRLNAGRDKEKMFRQMHLSKLTFSNFLNLYAGLEILDAGSSDGNADQSTGFVTHENAAIWLRSFGWVWTDEEMHQALGGSASGTGGVQAAKYSFSDLMRIADSNISEETYEAALEEEEKEKAHAEQKAKDALAMKTGKPKRLSTWEAKLADVSQRVGPTPVGAFSPKKAAEVVVEVEPKRKGEFLAVKSRLPTRLQETDKSLKKLLETFDPTNTGKIMRGDLIKIIENGGRNSRKRVEEDHTRTQHAGQNKIEYLEAHQDVSSKDCAEMFEQLGYPSTKLTFEIRELAERLAESLNNIPSKDMLA